MNLRHPIEILEGTEYLVQRHELGLSHRDEMAIALEAAGFEISYDEEGLSGRGFYFGRLGHDWWSDP